MARQQAAKLHIYSQNEYSEFVAQNTLFTMISVSRFLKINGYCHCYGYGSLGEYDVASTSPLISPEKKITSCCPSHEHFFSVVLLVSFIDTKCLSQITTSSTLRFSAVFGWVYYCIWQNAAASRGTNSFSFAHIALIVKLEQLIFDVRTKNLI